MSMATVILAVEHCVGAGAKQVARVEMAFASRLVRALNELPVVESGTKAARDPLWVLGAVVVAETVVGEAHGFGEHPPLTVVLSKKGFDARRAISSCILATPFKKVLKCHQAQDGVAKLRGQVSIYAPEPPGIQGSGAE